MKHRDEIIDGGARTDDLGRADVERGQPVDAGGLGVHHVDRDLPNGERSVEAVASHVATERRGEVGAAGVRELGGIRREQRLGHRVALALARGAAPGDRGGQGALVLRQRDHLARDVDGYVGARDRGGEPLLHLAAVRTLDLRSASA